METNPEAPAGQAPESVAPTNTNPEPQASATPFFDKMSETDRKSIDTFLANNGGIEAFNKWKQAVSNPQPKVPEPQAQAQAQVQVQTQTPEPQVRTQMSAPEPEEPAQGYITPTQIAALQYNQMLRENEQYANIKDYIKDGTFLTDMVEMGMSPVDAKGNLNDFAIRKFLDLKAQTVPAIVAGAPTTSTAPTVQYIQVGDAITSADEAWAVMQQPDHPRHQDAVNYLATQINLGK